VVALVCEETGGVACVAVGFWSVMVLLVAALFDAGAAV
jgi:hypothetical protein